MLEKKKISWRGQLPLPPPCPPAMYSPALFYEYLADFKSGAPTWPRCLLGGLDTDSIYFKLFVLFLLLFLFLCQYSVKVLRNLIKKLKKSRYLRNFLCKPKMVYFVWQSTSLAGKVRACTRGNREGGLVVHYLVHTTHSRGTSCLWFDYALSWCFLDIRRDTVILRGPFLWVMSMTGERNGVHIMGSWFCPLEKEIILPRVGSRRGGFGG